MKLTSALGAIGASGLLLSGVGAVDLDINSPGAPDCPKPTTSPC
jgi:hypothetical protein